MVDADQTSIFDLAEALVEKDKADAAKAAAEAAGGSEAPEAPEGNPAPPEPTPEVKAAEHPKTRGKKSVTVDVGEAPKTVAPVSENGYDMRGIPIDLPETTRLEMAAGREALRRRANGV